MHTPATALPCPSSRSPSASAPLLPHSRCATPSGRRCTPRCSPTGSRPTHAHGHPHLPLHRERSAQITAGHPRPGWARGTPATAAERHTLTPCARTGLPSRLLVCVIHLTPCSIHRAPPGCLCPRSHAPAFAPHAPLSPRWHPSRLAPSAFVPHRSPRPSLHPPHPLGCLCPHSHRKLHHSCPLHLCLHPMPPSVRISNLCIHAPRTIHVRAPAIRT